MQESKGLPERTPAEDATAAILAELEAQERRIMADCEAAEWEVRPTARAARGRAARAPARARAEELLRRVAALAGRHYDGAGFHYVLERQAHALMVETCPERWYEGEALVRAALTETAEECLRESVRAAEVSALRHEGALPPEVLQ